MEYTFYLKTWGGFYNKEHAHGYKEGDFFFSSKEERDEYISKLKNAQLIFPQAQSLVIHLDDGYHLKTPVKVHRVVVFEGKEYYSECDMFYGSSYSECSYYLKYKWYPGFNDYPLGEDFDYSKINNVRTWISGAFKEYDYER